MTRELEQPIMLEAVRGFHIGGAIVTREGLPPREMQTIVGNPLRQIDPNGHYAVGQLYAQHFVQVQPVSPYPLHFWHGGGLTGACWEDTPDGRPGWLPYFLRRGHHVLLTDAPERGRASWAPYPEINAEAPWHRTIEQAWSMFRIGPDGGYHPDPSRRVAYSDSQFPVEAADQMLRQFVARWGSAQSDRWAESAYEALLEKVGPSVVIAHSQGGLYALALAARRPELFRAIVTLEPVLPLDLSADRASALARVPLLLIIGDNYVFPGTPRHMAFLNTLRAAGSAPEILKLSDLGIIGNSHMMMMDRNSDHIAGVVEGWLAERGAA